MNEPFIRDVMKGLSASPKYLPSKYFYDKKGDLLFQEIMELDEYYLTRCEFKIFQNEKDELLTQFSKSGKPFDLIEFGAGDGKKTKILLEHFINQGANFAYLPIDISQNALTLLAEDLRQSFPQLDFKTLQGEYFEVLSHLKHQPGRTKVVLFLGSNIGNFLKDLAANFLSELAHSLYPDDMLLLGVDLVKDPEIVAKAYNDKLGVTRAFNMNLLERINQELGGDFDLAGFNHFPFYDPVTGTSRSFLISNRNQTVHIARMNASFHFDSWEAMYMEHSQKYRLDELTQLANHTGFGVTKNYLDQKQYFVNGLWHVLNDLD